MGLGFKLQRKKMSCTKISRCRELNAWRMKITTCTGNFSCKTTFFKLDPSARKLQGPGEEQNKIKEN